MHTEWYCEYSYCLNREMEFKIYGHAGKPCIVFPSQNGRFYDYENNGMIASVEGYINEGRLRLVCVDCVDGDTFSASWRNGFDRGQDTENYYNYIVEELARRLYELTGYDGKLMTTGCSMGAYHAFNFFCRRPDVFDAVISLSGIYKADYFFNGYMDDCVYNNSPIDYLQNLPYDHFYIDLYNNSNIILCVGQGAWEDDMLDSLYQIKTILDSKGVHVQYEYWGHDVCHDWPWWRIQLPYLMSRVV